MSLKSKSNFEDMWNPIPTEDTLDDGTAAQTTYSADHGVASDNAGASRLRDIPNEYEGKVVSKHELNKWFEDDSQANLGNIEENEDNDMPDFDTGVQQVETITDDMESNWRKEDTNVNHARIVSKIMQRNVEKVEQRQKETMKLMEVESKIETQHQNKKSLGVTEQTIMYDQVASIRIHLQKPLQIATKFPRPSTIQNNDGLLPASLKRKLKEVESEALGLGEEILNIYDGIKGKGEGGMKRRCVSSSRKESILSRVENDWKEDLSYWNRELDAWNRKMKLVRSHLEKRGGNSSQRRRQEEESLLERIAVMVDNPERILEKLQCVDSNFRMYGDKREEGRGGEEKENGGDMSVQDEKIKKGLMDPSALKYANVKKEKEVYNDSQLYKRMLKEIIDIGQSDSIAGGVKGSDLHKTVEEIEERKRREKMEFRKVKLRMRYTIRPDMLNFMAPRLTHDSEFPFQQLFRSLFQ